MPSTVALLRCSVPLALTVAALPAGAEVRITEEVNKSSYNIAEEEIADNGDTQTAGPTVGDINSDWFELTNFGPTAVDLTGYVWDDAFAADDEAIFPAVSIAPGESIVIIQEDTEEAAETFRAAWGLSSDVQILYESLFTGNDTFSGLSSGGDNIFLFDASRMLVDNVTFGPAPLPTGDPAVVPTYTRLDDATVLTPSIEGVDGAYRGAIVTLQNAGAFQDIGSPGFAPGAVIPEPTTTLLLGGMTAGVMVRRRRAGR